MDSTLFLPVPVPCQSRPGAAKVSQHAFLLCQQKPLIIYGSDESNFFGKSATKAACNKRHGRDHLFRFEISAEFTPEVPVGSAQASSPVTHDKPAFPKLQATAPDSPSSQKPQVKHRPRVVVLGTGWAGHAIAKSVNAVDVDLIVVSPRNYFLFTPLLPSSSVGTVEFRSITDSIKTAAPTAQYIEATCEKVDAENKRLLCKHVVGGEDFYVEYDQLVVAVGTRTATFNTPGVHEHCCFLREVEDATSIRRRLLDCFERAAYPDISEEEKRQLLSVVVVGGGPTGVEFAAEFHDLFQENLIRVYPDLIPYVSVHLIEARPNLLSAFDQTLQDYAKNAFTDQHIDMVMGKAVKRVTATSVELQDGKVIPFGVCVWATGNDAHPLVKQLLAAAPAPADVPRGRLPVDSLLRVAGFKDIFACGDCSYVLGETYPQTAQVAGQQGVFIGKLLSRMARGTAKLDEPSVPPHLRPRPFKFFSLGRMSYVGHEQSIIEAPFEAPFKALLRGHLAWVFWRSAYWVKQVSMRNRFLILFDWINTALYGRDISRL